MDKGSNFIGEFFRQYIKQRRVDRKVFAQRLGMNYSDNERMICAYLVKKDYLWEQYEVEKWCNVLGISESAPIYTRLVNKAGKKSFDNL